MGGGETQRRNKQVSRRDPGTSRGKGRPSHLSPDESGVGLVVSHTATPRQRDSLSKGLKGKGKARSADETFICLKNIARLKDTCNRNGSGP